MTLQEGNLSFGCVGVTSLPDVFLLSWLPRAARGAASWVFLISVQTEQLWSFQWSRKLFSPLYPAVHNVQALSREGTHVRLHIRSALRSIQPVSSNCVNWNMYTTLPSQPWPVFHSKLLILNRLLLHELPLPVLKPPRAWSIHSALWQVLQGCSPSHEVLPLLPFWVGPISFTR